jgi:excinuclease UvrABC nuclease subunit
MGKDIIRIPEIVLEWSSWYLWEKLKTDVRTGVGIKIPKEPGVYEVRLNDNSERLTIGKARNLQMRIRQGLVKGQVPHSAGKRIRENENPTEIFVRWAVTDRPSAVEEELHRQYQDQFGQLPKYTVHT